MKYFSFVYLFFLVAEIAIILYFKYSKFGKLNPQKLEYYVMLFTGLLFLTSYFYSIFVESDAAATHNNLQWLRAISMGGGGSLFLLYGLYRMIRIRKLDKTKSDKIH